MRPLVLVRHVAPLIRRFSSQHLVRHSVVAQESILTSSVTPVYVDQEPHTDDTGNELIVKLVNFSLCRHVRRG